MVIKIKKRNDWFQATETVLSKTAALENISRLSKISISIDHYETEKMTCVKHQTRHYATMVLKIVPCRIFICRRRDLAYVWCNVDQPHYGLRGTSDLIIVVL